MYEQPRQTDHDGCHAESVEPPVPAEAVEPPVPREFRTIEEVADTFIGEDYKSDSGFGKLADVYFPEDQVTGRKRAYFLDVAADIVRRGCSPAEVMAKHGLTTGQIAGVVDLIVRHGLYPWVVENINTTQYPIRVGVSSHP